LNICEMSFKTKPTKQSQASFRSSANLQTKKIKLLNTSGLQVQKNNKVVDEQAKTQYINKESNIRYISEEPVSQT
ncbi:9621_t:CDS:1, partial [Dentiscutata erythropus]